MYSAHDWTGRFTDKRGVCILHMIGQDDRMKMAALEAALDVAIAQLSLTSSSSPSDNLSQSLDPAIWAEALR